MPPHDRTLRQQGRSNGRGVVLLEQGRRANPTLGTRPHANLTPGTRPHANLTPGTRPHANLTPGTRPHANLTPGTRLHAHAQLHTCLVITCSHPSPHHPLTTLCAPPRLRPPPASGIMQEYYLKLFGSYRSFISDKLPPPPPPPPSMPSPRSREDASSYSRSSEQPDSESSSSHRERDRGPDDYIKGSGFYFNHAGFAASQRCARCGGGGGPRPWADRKQPVLVYYSGTVAVP